MYDFCVIGGGAIGCAIVRELTRYTSNVALVEANEDVCTGTSGANSAIVHSGYDPKTGTLMAKYNVLGSKLFRAFSASLEVPYKQTGSLTVATTPNEEESLKNLLLRGQNNGVQGLQLLSRDEALALEGNLADGVRLALYAPTTAIINPFELCFALRENAEANGARFYFNFDVTYVYPTADSYTLLSKKGDSVETKYVINCAGTHGGEIARLFGDRVALSYRAGEYRLFEKSNVVSRPIFSAPTFKGKGVLVCPTIDGNFFIGPTASDRQTPSNYFRNTAFEELERLAQKSVKNLPLSTQITKFVGIRTLHESGDFNIFKSKSPRVMNVIGICSPGISAVPAIASAVVKEFGLTRRDSFIPTRKAIVKFSALNAQKRAELISKNPSYGRIVCHCEQVTEGEILEAIKRGACTVDGVKKRVRAGMGVCQGGYCASTVRELLRGGAVNSEEDATEKLKLPKHVQTDVLVIGGGAGGMASAIAASNEGARVIIVEREKLGGILNRCIHNGFGLSRFNEELTGPEYSARYVSELKNNDRITLCYGEVVSLDKKTLQAEVISHEGVTLIKARSVVLSTGSRERAFGSLAIGGHTPKSGIMTAGTAQKLVNIHGESVGKKIVILGSGDIGLIMARRLTLEGAKVEAVIEIKPTPSGLARNVSQCLNDFHIPLLLSSSIVEVHGGERVEEVVVAQVDEKLRPVQGTEQTIKCDTLILSVGLIPTWSLLNDVEIDNRTKSVVVDSYGRVSKGIFVCGNALHVHDLVDNVSLESETVGRYSAIYALSGKLIDESHKLTIGNNVATALPQRLSNGVETKIYIRASRAFGACKIVFKTECGEVVKEVKKPAISNGETSIVNVTAIEPLIVSVEEV